MPKISVHLEADSAEEFRELLTALAAPAQTVRWDSWKHEPKDSDQAHIEALIRPEPEVSPGPDMPADMPLEQLRAPKRRGRPAKAAPVEPEPAPAAAVLEPEPEPTPEPETDAGGMRGSLQPQPRLEPVKAKPKTMPHAQPENGAATRQDLLDAFSEYVQRYGASFGFSDISSLLQKNLGDGVRKASDVPEEKLSVAIGAIKTAIADNPFNRKRDYA